MPILPGEGDPKSHADPHAPLTPLALMLALMRQHYDAGEYEAAITLAKIAAPYFHPRASATNPTPDLATMLDADLEQLSPRG